MIPGMAQAKLERSGMKLFPDRPTPAISRSIRNAARAMYPLASISRMKKNRITICGRKTTTEPTPASTPSVTKSRRTPSGSSAMAHSLRIATTPSSASAKGVAQANTAWNTTNSSANRISGPTQGLSNTRSKPFSTVWRVVRDKIVPRAMCFAAKRRSV